MRQKNHGYDYDYDDDEELNPSYLKFIFLHLAVGALVIGGLIYIGEGLFKWYGDGASDKAYRKISDQIEEELATVDEDSNEYTPPETLLDLMEENSDVVGYLSIDKTRISYPIVQAPGGEADDYYLHLDLDKEYSYPGTIFLEQNQDISEGYAHSIFGHNMKNGTMFGCLPKFALPEFVETHKYGSIYTKTEEIKLEVVGFYEDTEKPNLLQICRSETRAGFLLSQEFGIEFDPGNYYILTTCMYREENDRGFLVLKRTN